jgi:hypothetical protein
LILLALGTLLIVPFLGYMATGLTATKVFEEVMTEGYAADAGVEHAIWRIRYKPDFADSLIVGEPVTYTVTINGIEVLITVTKVE